MELLWHISHCSRYQGYNSETKPDTIPSSYEILSSSGGKETTNTLFKCPVYHMVINGVGTNLARHWGKSAYLDHVMGQTGPLHVKE